MRIENVVTILKGGNHFSIQRIVFPTGAKMLILATDELNKFNTGQWRQRLLNIGGDELFLPFPSPLPSSPSPSLPSLPVPSPFPPFPSPPPPVLSALPSPPFPSFPLRSRAP